MASTVIYRWLYLHPETLSDEASVKWINQMSRVRYLVDFFLFLKDNAFSFSSAANIVLLFLVFSGAAPSIVLHLSKKPQNK